MLLFPRQMRVRRACLGVLVVRSECGRMASWVGKLSALENTQAYLGYDEIY